MAERLNVQSNDHSYPIFIGDDLRFEAGAYVNQAAPNYSKCMIIADEHVASLYLEDVLSSFSVRPETALVPSGEGSKSMKQFERLLTLALEADLDRQSVIVALGGGVAGDLAGFAAASYMRGIRFLQMPTTLLAHDSSVGGKTGINHPLGKNLIGAFHPPHGVIYDASMLQSLSEREWRSGFAEVVKHGLIDNKGLFQWLQHNTAQLVQLEGPLLHELLKRSIQVKIEIVQQDEFEHGTRAFLNLGHTLGHAIEAESGYGSITHGEAVAIGIIFAMKLSERHYNVQLPVHSLIKYLQENGYQTTIPEDLSAHALLRRMKRDKKAAAGKMNFVLLKAIGEPEVVSLSEDFIKQELQRGSAE